MSSGDGVSVSTFDNLITEHYACAVGLTASNSVTWHNGCAGTMAFCHSMCYVVLILLLP